jgi:opine dehydrogenase
MTRAVAVIGAGNGGKTVAADLALQGWRVCLAELPEFSQNLDELRHDPVLHVEGAFSGRARLDNVTTRLDEALGAADLILICCQALAHERLAHELAPLVSPRHILVLNPGSTGGALHLARVFRQLGRRELPVMVEFSTLTYGCRAQGNRVACAVKVGRIVYGVFPDTAAERVAPLLEPLFPGLVRGRHVLEAGLNNANPVIHPPITLLNAARFENEGERMLFYGDGVSPTVARLIASLDGERMALLRALGCHAQPDPLTSVQQGYAQSPDYLECYRHGSGFSGFRSPNTLDHRYLHEDVGMGLVLYCRLGEQLGVPTPTSQAVVHFGGLVAGLDYLARGARTPTTLGLEGMTVEQMTRFLLTGRRDP